MLRPLFKTVLIASVFGLAACSLPPDGGGADGIHDPYEKTNRKIHAFNRGLDKNLVRPLGVGYASTIPDEFQDGVGNMASNLAEPSNAVNHLMQGDIESAAVNTYRFAVNTVLGFGGFGDVAAEFGVPARDTDFGETLFVFGVKEGAYVELPLLGPSTERAAVGKVVDLFTNPLSYVLPEPEAYAPAIVGGIARVGDRGRYAETVDSILYDSADSYAQARLLYLQNRRYTIGAELEGGSTDPYFDPYEDPYAE